MNIPDSKSLKHLSLPTRNVLVRLADLFFLREFTFVGGSAISVYLNHRLSEDIDLFSHLATLKKAKIIEALENNFPENFSLENETTNQLDLKIENVQVTFFANNWDKLEEKAPFLNHLFIASLDLLVGMKINTLFLRAKFRDYYDLYALSESGYSVKQMYDIAKAIMPSINHRLFQMALTYTNDITDDNISHLAPKYLIDKKTIGSYFDRKVQNWLEK